MFWFLLLLGILLVFVGAWGGPRVPRHSAEKEIPRQAPVSRDPWEVLTEPLPQEEELIKLPEERPWYALGKDNRFLQGLFVGLGAGLMVAGAVTLIPSVGSESAPSPVVAQEPGASAPEGDVSEQVAQKPVDQVGDTKSSEDLVFTIGEGELPSDVAERLQEAGLIADGDAFLARLTELGLDTSLRAGDFTVPGGADLDEVISALTVQ